MTKTIVVGHRNPDNDSICSAVAYAHLRNYLDNSEQYLPVRLGHAPEETTWIFNKMGLVLPQVMTHVYIRVCDAMTTNVISLNKSATLLEAGLLMRKHNIRALIITDDAGRYCGLFTTRMLAELYITEMEQVQQSGQNTTAGERFETLEHHVSDYLDTGALILAPDALLKDVADDILGATLRQAVILDEKGICVGIITRTDIARTPRRRVILVDHNESSQSIRGIGEAEVVGILDHHRIGDIQSSSPIQFINYPLGSTATIVVLEYQRNHVEPPLGIAGILLSAIMTDTVMLKSPTTTQVDKDTADYLGKLLGEDPVQFGIELFGRKDNATTSSIESLVEADLKEFELGDVRVAIAQHETVNLDSVLKREPEIVAHLASLVEARGYQFALLLATDVIAEGSQFIAAGNLRTLERVFNINFADGSVWLPGILSRKKQVTPNLFEHVV